jgi:hypothetical protein
MFVCNCPVHPCAVVQKTLHTVKITYLETGDERRASLDIALLDANVDLRVDNGMQDRHVRILRGIENRGPAPHEMVDGGDIRALADASEEN